MTDTNLQQGTGSEATPPQQPPAPATPAPVVPQQGEGESWQTWKSRYTGVNQALQEKVTAFNALSGEHQTLATKIEAERAQWQVKEQEATKTIADLNEQIKQLSVKNQSYENEKSTRTLIKEKFSGLLDHFDRGFLIGLNNLEGEAREKWLTEYQDYETERAQGNLKTQLQGAPPQQQSTPNSGAMSEQEIQDKLFTLDPNSREYLELEKQYFELIRKKKQTPNP